MESTSIDTYRKILPSIYKLPYPKIEKTFPQLLTPDQYNRLIFYFCEHPDFTTGLRNLIINLLHITTDKDIDETITF